MTSQLARQLTRYPRIRTRIVQAFAGCFSIAVALALAIAAGREPQKPNPMFAQQMLHMTPMQLDRAPRQTIRISEAEANPAQIDAEADGTMLLRQGLTPDAVKSQRTAWAANTTSVTNKAP